MLDLIIIGAGPAGLTAAIYAKRAGLDVLVLDKNLYGGQVAITDKVENYPAIEKISGAEFALNIYNQAQKQGVEIKFEEVKKVNLIAEVKEIMTDSETFKAKSIIIANGVQRRMLECPGEKRLIGKGVSYCATCDGAFFRNQKVVVIGGGNTAISDAIFLSNICEKVYVLNRSSTLKAQSVLVEAANKRENIEIKYNCTIKEISGEDKVESILVENTNDNTTFTLNTNAVFVAIGLIPKNQMFKDFIDIDKNGYIVSQESCQTKIPGVFAAGDTRDKFLRQIITAAADGAIAATRSAEFLNM